VVGAGCEGGGQIRHRLSQQRRRQRGEDAGAAGAHVGAVVAVAAAGTGLPWRGFGGLGQGVGHGFTQGLHTRVAGRMRVDQRHRLLTRHAARGLGPGAEIVLQHITLEAAPRERCAQHRQPACGAHLGDITREVDGELGGQIGAATGLAGLVVVAELDQHDMRCCALARLQPRQHTLPGTFFAVALCAAPASRQVQAGPGWRKARAERVAIAGARRQCAVAHQQQRGAFGVVCRSKRLGRGQP